MTMKNHLPSAIILFVLLLAFCFHAIAADNKSYSGTSTLASTQSGYLFTSTLETSSVDYLDVIDPVATDTVATLLRTTPDITVNGTWIAARTATITADGTTYLSITPVLQALFPNVSVTLKNGRLTASGNGLSLEAIAEEAYFMVNDRYFYVPSLVMAQENDLLAPRRITGQRLGLFRGERARNRNPFDSPVGRVATANTYVEEDLYWLSRAIYSESGNQPMKGRIAVEP